MIAVEKLRAICQQMATYPYRKHPAPRPRDFYDVYSVVTGTGVDLRMGTDLIQKMFAAKDVSISLLDDIEGQREFHRQGWTAVQNSVRDGLLPFDFYFDFVLAEVRKLEVIGNP
jgi:hypothetical protein